MKRASGIFILLALVALLGWTFRSVEQAEVRAFRSDAGGHSLEMSIAGGNGPVVVLESGLPGGMGWPAVQRIAGRFARVVSYSRAGIGKSDPGPQPRDAAQIAKELHTALHNANLPPPYVMVGQSMGGPYVRVFAATYPDEVAGLVIVDPARADGAVSFEEARDWFAANRPEQWPRVHALCERVPDGGAFMLASTAMGLEQTLADMEPAERETLREEFWALVESHPERLSPTLSPGARDEFKSARQSFDQANSAAPLPAVPAVLLVAGQFDEIMELTANLTPHLRKFQRIMREQKMADHRRWVEATPGATLIFAEQSGHNIQTEDPQKVIDAVRDVIARSPLLRR